MNEQNLVKYTEMSPAEKEEFHSRGGKAGAAARRRKRTFRETLQEAMARQITVEQGRERLEALGYDGTWMDLLSQAQIDRAAKGDTEAFRAVRDTMGESPKQAVDVGLTNGPVSGMDLSQLSDDQLRAMIAAREEASEND